MQSGDCSVDNAVWQRRWQRWGWGWLLMVVGMTLLLAWQLPQARINSSVLALLPQEEADTPLAKWQSPLAERLDRQLVWLIHAPAGAEAARWWQQQLGQLQGINQVVGDEPSLTRQWADFYARYRYQLSNPQIDARMQQGATAWLQWVRGQLYSPFAGVSLSEWRQDPLLLTRQMLMAQTHGPLRLQQGWLLSQDAAGRDWYLIRAELAGSAFDLTRSHLLVAELDQLQRQLVERFPGARLLQRGTLFYSEHAAELAKADISTIGLGSLLGVVLVIWWAFRGLRPLWLCMLPLGVGLVAGLLAVLLCFGQIHLFTLVICTSLIGISDDYSLHYLSERRLHPDETPWATALRLWRPLLMALLTTLLGYLLLWLAPFPGLQQMAVFSLVGLLASFITVFCWMPPLVGKMTCQPLPARHWMEAWLQLWQTRRWLRQGVPWLLLLPAAYGLSLLVVDDDVRRLQPLPVELQHQEQQIATLTGQGSDLTGFLVTGDSEQQVLQRAERLDTVLASLKAQRVLTEYRNLTGMLPSLARQQARYQALTPLAAKVAGALPAMAAAALPAFEPLTPQAWLASPVSQGWRLLWLQHGDDVALLVPVYGVHDLATLQQATSGLPGIYWQDKRQSWSDLFARYRILLAGLLATGVLLAVGYMVWRLGWRPTARIMVANGVALLLATAALGVAGLPFTLFSLLALSLVFGIGVDYGLFFAHCAAETEQDAAADERRLATLLAILLANLTTQLGFGLLALSHTQAIASFGLVLSVGVLVSFLLAPLALPRRPDSLEPPT